MSRRLIGLAIAALAAACFGCTEKNGTGSGAGDGKGAAPGAPKAAAVDQSSPKDTLKTVVAALLNGDRNAYVSSFKADGDQKKIVETTYDLSEPGVQLKSAIDKSYGPDGWTQFQQAQGAVQQKGLEQMTPEKIDSLKVDQQGDQATVSMPGGPPTKMVKENGKWLIDASQMFKGMVNSDQMAKMVDMLKPAFQNTMAQVGKPGQTPQTLAQLFKDEMTKGMMQGAAGFLKNQKAIQTPQVPSQAPQIPQVPQLPGAPAAPAPAPAPDAPSEPAK